MMKIMKMTRINNETSIDNNNNSNNYDTNVRD